MIVTKTLFYGISLAAMGAMAIGGALRPAGNELVPRDSAPRQEIAYGGASYEQTYGGTTTYAYGVPDYVVGTDHLPPTYASYEQPYEPETDMTTSVSWDLPAVEPASYKDLRAPEPAAEAPRVRYPSEGGGVIPERTAAYEEPQAYSAIDAGEDAVAEEDGPGPEMALAEVGG